MATPSKTRTRSSSITDGPASATRRRTRSSSLISEEEVEEPVQKNSKRPKVSKTDKVMISETKLDPVEEDIRKTKKSKKSSAKKNEVGQVNEIIEETIDETLIEKVVNKVRIVPGVEVEAIPVNVVQSIKNHIDKGRNVSGRGWKRTNQKRASTFMRNDKVSGRSKSWEERQANKQRREDIKQMEKEMKELQRSEKADARKVREERAAMRAANEMKNTVLQTISKTHKLKTMNKKQLRQIKKTAVNAKTGALELVSPWQK